MRKAGCTFEEAKAAGFVKGLKEAGYSCSEAKKARFAPKLLRAAGYTCIDARAAGYTKELKLAGYTPTEARAAGSSCEEAKEAGYVQGLCEAGYTVKVSGPMVLYECRLRLPLSLRMPRLFDALPSVRGYSCLCVCVRTFAHIPQECFDANFECAHVRMAGFIEGVAAAGFTIKEAKVAGYSSEGLRLAGFSCMEVAQTCTEAKAAGYTAAQCHAAGWSWKAIADAGYSIRSAKPKGDMTPNATELQDLSC